MLCSRLDGNGKVCTSSVNLQLKIAVPDYIHQRHWCRNFVLRLIRSIHAAARTRFGCSSVERLDLRHLSVTVLVHVFGACSAGAGAASAPQEHACCLSGMRSELFVGLFLAIKTSRTEVAHI